MIEPPHFGTEERQEYDICDLELLGSLAIRLGVAGHPMIKRAFSRLVDRAGCRGFPEDCCLLYQLLMNLDQSLGYAAHSSSPSSSPNTNACSSPNSSYQEPRMAPSSWTVDARAVMRHDAAFIQAQSQAVPHSLSWHASSEELSFASHVNSNDGHAAPSLLCDLEAHLPTSMSTMTSLVDCPSEKDMELAHDEAVFLRSVHAKAFSSSPIP